MFPECTFINQDNKTFLLEEIKKIKKLPIKKTKIIFKLDKLSPLNPHDYIDNIPNIVILIELTNKKVLGAFTQTAFSREDTSLGDRPSFKSNSRVNSNKALIVDLTNKVAFHNKVQNDAIIYD